MFELPLKDRQGIEPGQEIYHATRNNNFEEATNIPRKMIVQYAMIKYKGNKAKVAAQLDVARQHSYKPCLKDMFSMKKPGKEYSSGVNDATV